MYLLPKVDCSPKSWTVLKELHAPTSVVATLMLERELSTLRLSEGEPWVRTKILEEDFRRRQQRGGDDGSSGYEMQGSKHGRGRGFGGARRTTTPTTNKEVLVGVAVQNLDVGTSQHTGAEKKKELNTGQIFHIGEQGEQGDASTKAGAELHPLDYWVLDTSAAWTMTSCKEVLDDVRAAPINDVCSASGHALKVAGARRAAFKGADGKPVVLHNILLVPDLKANLISLRKLAKAGVSTSTDGARMYKGQLGNRVLWDLHESKDVYRSMWQVLALAWHGGGQAVEGSASQGECNAVGGVGVKLSARSGETDWATTHRRLGHVAMPLLKQLEKDGGAKGATSLWIWFTWTWWGHCRCKGTRGSRLIWAYLLKQKDHAASTIREDWLPFVEKQAECVVKRIMTDPGGEFLGAEMTAWLKKQGIQRELTTANTPHSNGLAEQANWTILETARALLIDLGVGNSMWPHAVWHATVARNRVLTKVGNESWVPLERWLGRKPPVDMLRVFGCMVVTHVPKKYRRADVAEQQLGNEEALLILPHGYDPDEEDEPAYCFLALAPEEPASMEEALAGPAREKWLVSRDAEYQSLLENGIWDLVVQPEGKKAIQCKWVLRIKTDDKGQVTIYKSRLVAKGFMEKAK
ncbi:unnamed protein product [Closterium sp. NIES-53]